MNNKTEVLYRIFIIDDNGGLSEWIEDTYDLNRVEEMCKNVDGKFSIHKIKIESKDIGTYSKEEGLIIRDYQGFGDD